MMVPQSRSGQLYLHGSDSHLQILVGDAEFSMLQKMDLQHDVVKFFLRSILGVFMPYTWNLYSQKSCGSIIPTQQGKHPRDLSQTSPAPIYPISMKPAANSEVNIGENQNGTPES